LVTRSGAIWVGTDAGAGIYKNPGFDTMGSESGLAGPNVRRIIEDKDGSIWFCCDSWPNAGTPGGLSVFRNGIWRSYRKEDGLPSDYVVNFFRTRSGRALAATLGGVVEWVGDRWETVLRSPADHSINFGAVSFAETERAGLVCSTGRELYRWEGASWRLIPQKLSHEHAVLATEDGELLAVGEVDTRRRAFMAWRTNGWVQVSAAFPVPDDFVMDLRESPDGAIWAMGFDCLVHWGRRGGQWSEFPNLQDPKLIDPEGAIWFAQHRSWNRPGAMPVRLDDGNWRRGMGMVDGLLVGGDGAVWGWNSNRVTRWLDGATVHYGVDQTGIATNQFAAVDRKGGVWVLGRDGKGALGAAVFGPDRWQVQSFAGWPETRLWEAAAPGEDGLWLGMDQGQLTDAVLRWVGRGTSGDQSKGEIRIPRQVSEAYNGHIHLDRRGVLWLLGGTGLFRWEPGRSVTWEPIEGLPGRQLVSCVERGNELWFSCTGRTGGGSGVARLRDGVWKVFEVETQGAMALAHDRTILWGTEGRFFYVPDQPEAEPVLVQLPVPYEVRAVLKDLEGAYWVSAGDGVYRFRPDGIPPETVIRGPVRVTSGDTITFSAQGTDRFCQRGKSEDHRFEWRLDEGPWTSPTGRQQHRLESVDLSSGFHQIEVRCLDSAGDVDATPAMLRFDVLPMPLQRRSWFLPMVGVVVTVLATLALVTIRSQRKVAGYAAELEKRVAKRTAELEADIAVRRLAEKEAKEGQARFEKVFQVSPTIAAIGSYPEGRFLAANQCFTDTLGYSESDLYGRTAIEVELWVDPAEHRRIVASLDRGEPVRNLECRLYAKSGRIHTVLMSVERIELEGAQALLFISADVTERVRSERRRATEYAVARVMAESDTLAQALPMVLRTICEAENWSFGELWEAERLQDRLKRVAYWHPPSERFEALVTQGAMDTFAAGDGLPGIVWKAGAPVFIMDLARDPRFRRNQGAARAGLISGLGFPVRAEGKVTGVLLLLADRALGPSSDFDEMLGVIGSQMGQFISRTRTREDLRRFVSVSPGVLYVLRIRENGLEPSWYSPNLEAVTGYSVEAGLAFGWWWNHVHPDDLKRVQEAHPIPYQIEHQVLEYRFRRADRSYIWIRDEKRLLHDGERPSTEVVGTWSDVSERMELEARLVQAQKMEAIGLLSGGIAHDFNNILGAILGNAQLARQDVTFDHPAAESLDGIVQAARRAKSVVNQILEFARQESNEMRRTQLGPVIEQSLSLLRSTLTAEVALEVSVAPNTPPIFADSSRIQQSIVNLCTNAWQAFGGKPGTIEVNVGRVKVDAALAERNPDLRLGTYARICVRDTGCGMCRETLERIFDPYFTTKPPGTGTGLGLSVVHGIVKAHGGAILVTSAPGAGSTFELYFPAIKEGESKPGTVAPSSGTVQRGKNESVLLIDDKELIIRSCSRALDRLGYRVTSFMDGASALAEFHANPDAFQLLITDLSMPGLSGIEIARIVRKIRPGLPVILSSGLVPEQTLRELEAVGIRDLLRKPFSFEELGETVAQALKRTSDESNKA